MRHPDATRGRLTPPSTRAMDRPRQRARHRWLAAAAAAALLVSACSSSTRSAGPDGEAVGDAAASESPSSAADEPSPGASPSASSPDATSTEPDGAPTEATPDDGSTTEDGPGDPPATTDGGTTGGDTSDGGTSDGDGGGETMRPVAPGTDGVDDERIVVGLTYTEDSDEANESLGAGGISTGDPRRNYDVLLEYFNGRGGANGRRIEPVYHVYEATSNQQYNQQEEQACTTFTQDHHVFVSLAGHLSGISDGTFNACMHEAGTPVLASGSLSDSSDAWFARWPDFVQTPTLSLDEIARQWPAGLDENGYFEPRAPATDTLVGLVTYDTTQMRGVTENTLRPAMAGVGQSFEEERYVSKPNSFSDLGDISAQVQNAVLRFQTLDIEHVMIQDSGNALLTLLFMNSAESQNYRPRYGLTSNSGGQALVGAVPEEQFAEARVVAWLPILDVPASEFDEPMGQGRRLCDQIYEDAGITFSDPNARAVAYGQCDQFRSLITAVNQGSGPLSQDTLIDEFLSVGTGFESALIGPTKFAADRHYGVSRYRLAAFSDECGCFRYTTEWRAIP